MKYPNEKKQDQITGEVAYRVMPFFYFEEAVG